MAGNSPSGQRRSVPASDTTLISRAAPMRAAAALTRARSASVGTSRASTSGGSTASRILVPEARISCCSGENSSVIRSSTRSLSFKAAIAALLPVSGVVPK